MDSTIRQDRRIVCNVGLYDYMIKLGEDVILNAMKHALDTFIRVATPEKACISVLQVL
jgi:hypothetical protein